MGKIDFILIESGLELIPEKLWNMPTVKSYSKRRGKPPRKLLLDKSIHYKDMKRAQLNNVEKRGRPDIVHISLLTILSSLMSKRGFVSSVYIHTFNNKLIRIDPSTRIPRNYNRFIGLMEQLLDKGRVPPNSKHPLMEIIDMQLDDLISNYDSFIVFEKNCHRLNEKFLSQVKSKNVLLGFGSFPHGSINRSIVDKATACYSLSELSLDSWAAIGLALCFLEAKVLKII